MDNPIMTMEQVAEYLQLSLRYCYRLIRDEGLPATMIGNKWRVHRADLDQWVRGRAKKTVRQGK